MKKVFYSLTVLAFVFTFASCSNDDDQHDFNNAKQDVTLRATALGFSDMNAHTTAVAEQCAAGNHENCDIQTNGTHQACGYAEHTGTNHDGTQHNGTEHGTHDANGHSHNSHSNENHGNESHNGGGHH